jgi:hypothetical protein
VGIDSPLDFGRNAGQVGEFTTSVLGSGMTPA